MIIFTCSATVFLSKILEITLQILMLWKLEGKHFENIRKNIKFILKKLNQKKKKTARK